MTDLGGFDARATVLSSAQEQEAVFARHRARIVDPDPTPAPAGLRPEAVCLGCEQDRCPVDPA